MRYRADIDGLRSVAVLSVLLFHTNVAGFTGGYTGVDVFFVISGYLITGKIEAEIARGSFTFSGFYFGRARRLLPALFTTLAVTFAFGALLLAPNHLKLMGQSTIWAAIPFSNVYFWFTSGYWDVGSTLKPLLHTWSLSVEEQYYFVWPLALWGLARFRGWAAPAALAAAGIVSFIAALAFMSDVPSTFYLTPFRVFEFALGALLVWVERTPRHRAVNELSAILGLLLVLWPVFRFPAEVPTAWMIVPCLGAALLIHAGPGPLVSRLWNNPVAVYLGKASYSIYLVHWPLIVLYAYWRFVPITELERYALVASSIVLALPLHHFVEQRFRYASPERRRRPPWAIAAASTGLVLLGASAQAGQGWSWRLSADPDIVALYYQEHCQNGVGICEIDHPDAVLIGDSHAGHYEVAVSKTLRELGLRGKSYKRIDACNMVLDIYSALKWNQENGCLALKQQWLAQIAKDNPRFIIMAGFWEDGLGWGFGGRYNDGKTSRDLDIPETRVLFAKHMQETVERFLSEGRKVIVLSSGPIVDKPPAACFERPALLGRIDCASLNKITDPTAHAFVRKTLHELASTHPGMFYFDGFSYLCKDDYHCALGSGNASFYLDRDHLTNYGALWLQTHAFGRLIEFMKAEMQVNVERPEIRQSKDIQQTHVARGAPASGAAPR